MTNTGIRSLLCVLALIPFVNGCHSDSAGPSGDKLVITGNNQSALGGTAVGPVVVALQDGSGRPVAGQTATFRILTGGGSLSSSAGQTNPDGTITAPTWTLGKSVVKQQMEVSAGGQTAVVDATVQTSYSIEIVFFGPGLTATQQAMFTNAAARVKAIIVGALPPVDVNGADLKLCTGTTMAPATGTVAGVRIYASVDSIDGRSKTLAQSGPCYVRQDQMGAFDYRTAIGRMSFDSADIAPLAASNQLEQTVVHEMLHVLGFGTFWTDKNLIINAGTPTSAYTGAGGVAGCQAVGGTVTCATSVPIENCVGRPTCGAGQQDSHWRENTFGTELMTAYLDAGQNPLSVMTIRSFEDLNYSVNTAAADAYTIAVGNLTYAASGFPTAAVSAASADWERPVKVPLGALPIVK